ncbi:TlpA disulfide reductase family protein [Pedobacter gandavensis]|uniref:TlpA disulfide reductase family protein n=1 Tax=Pedobacter gandavensis TaxID=2679963 RepID=UPI00292FC886|nr:TlpA disulfide reductase family protein [Pedobacter gandavensis]
MYLLLFPLSVLSQTATIKSNLELSKTNNIALIEKFPDSIKEHVSFINNFSKKDSSSLMIQYDKWMMKFPKSYVIPFAIGKFFYKNEDPKAKKYLLKAVSLKPDLDEGWYYLSIDALRWGDRDLYSYYLKKAMEADKKKLDYVIEYVGSIKNISKDKLDSLYLDIELRFRNTDAGANALFFLASNNDNIDIQRSYYDQLFKRYSISQPPIFRTGMSNYFTSLLNWGAYKDAFQLSIDMIYVVEKNKLEWKHKLKVAKCFLELKKLITEKQYAEALVMLNSIKLTDNFSNSDVNVAESVLLLKAELSDLLNNTQAAYDSVVVNYIKKPSDKLRTAMFEYGIKLGKDSSGVKQQIFTTRQANSQLAVDLSLEEYGSGNKISLKDFKGKLVLLTFWFPGCGPCRAEFPHFETVLKKFGNNQIMYIGVNGYNSQDDYVIPFMKSTGYSFTAVKVDLHQDLKMFAGDGYPRNYLIDKNGHIVASKFYINEDNERMLELLIAEQLEN